ncbi:Dynein light chain LC6, flagellar outer arm [Schistosoma japonicum]|nr:Dynein light chain LC6, flagellar outer arm [Schistosoma japonicum]
MEPQKVIVKSTGMPEDMQDYAIQTCLKAMKILRHDKDVASTLKRQFNDKYGRTWHCVVGSNFGSNVSHIDEGFIYFFVDRKSVLLFKTECA